MSKVRYGINCVVCGEAFYVHAYRAFTAKCCSRICHGMYLSQKYKGRIQSEEWRNKRALAMRGDKHRLWKGNNVGYKSLHQWLYRELGKPTKCLKCDSMDNVEWASISHEYKRELEDWMQLCKKCHCVYDRKDNYGVASKMYHKTVGGLGKKL